MTAAVLLERNKGTVRTQIYVSFNARLLFGQADHICILRHYIRWLLPNYNQINWVEEVKIASLFTTWHSCSKWTLRLTNGLSIREFASVSEFFYIPALYCLRMQILVEVSYKCIVALKHVLPSNVDFDLRRKWAGAISPRYLQVAGAVAKIELCDDCA